MILGGQGGELNAGGTGGEIQTGGSGGGDPEAPQIIQSDVLENACLDVAVDYGACGGGKLNLLNFEPVEGEEDHWMYRGCVALSDAFDGTCGGWLSQEFVFRWVAPEAGVYTFGLRGQYEQRTVRYFENDAGETKTDRHELLKNYSKKPVTMYVRNQCDRREPEVICQANRTETNTVGRPLTLELNANDEVYVVVDDWAETQSEGHASDEAEIHIYRADAHVSPVLIDMLVDIRSYDGRNGPLYDLNFAGRIRDDNADVKKVRLRFFDAGNSRISPIEGKDEIEFMLGYSQRELFHPMQSLLLDDIASQITRIEVRFEDWEGNESADWLSFEVGDSALAVDAPRLARDAPCDPYIISNLCEFGTTCEDQNEDSQFMCEGFNFTLRINNPSALLHGNRIVVEADFSGSLNTPFLNVMRNFSDDSDLVSRLISCDRQRRKSLI